MDMIRHFAPGTDPYKSCGSDRIPYRPAEGERITVRCLAEGGVPELTLCVDGEKKMIPGTPDPETAAHCFRFDIGPFRAESRVEYRIREGTVQTKLCPFTVLRWAALAECRALYLIKDGVFAELSLDTGRTVLLHASPKAHGFELRPCAELPPAGKAVESCELTGGAEGSTLLLEREPFRLILRNAHGETLFSLIHAVFALNADGEVAKYRLKCRAAGHGFYGFGEKFDRVNQRGSKVRALVYERFTHQGECSYLPVPWFFTDCGYGVYCASDTETSYDLTGYDGNDTRLVLEGEAEAGAFPTFHLLTGTPAVLLQALQRLTGPCALPPDWAFGPWISANGWNSQAEAMEQVEQLHRTGIPATVMVLEAWSDESTFYIWNGARYSPRLGGNFRYTDFAFDPDGPWPDPRALVNELHKNGLHLVLWQIPALKPAQGVKNGDTERQVMLDEREAIENGYCVQNADGTPYRIPDKWFAGSLVPDFTNPAAVDWWFQKRRYLVEDLGIEGFKTDGGEFIYDPECRFHNGKTGAEMRNLYPVCYTRAYYDFLQRAGGGVTFSRAGYTGAQKSPLHWAGDQVSTFGEMRAQLRAGLSAGLSGIPFWGFDLAGFAGDLPNTELYLRAAAMALFSPVMQFHSEPRSGQFGDSARRSWVNDRSPWNMARVNGSPEIVAAYRRLAELRMKLLPYICREAAFTARTGRPLLCHPVYEFPQDAHVWDMEDEYLFGRGLLVAPVLEEGTGRRDVYLPDGTWTDFWTGETLAGRKSIAAAAPLGLIPVYISPRASKEDRALFRDAWDGGRSAGVGSREEKRE